MGELQTLEDHIRDVDFMYENSPVKVIANYNHPAIELVGLSVGPFEEGNVYEVKDWIAEELEKAGIVSLQEGERLDLITLFRIHEKCVKLHSPEDTCRLEEFFYPKLNRFLRKLEEDASKDPDKLGQLKTARDLSNDIMANRLNKIFLWARVSLTIKVLEKLTPEEKLRYSRLKSLYDGFKKTILSSLNGEDSQSQSLTGTVEMRELADYVRT